MAVIRNLASLVAFLIAAGPAQSWTPAAWTTPRNESHIVVVQAALKGCRIDDMTGISGSQIRLAVTLLPGSQNESGTLFLSGLPDHMVLTAGTKVNKLWAIPAADARNTLVVTSAAVTGQFAIRLQCIVGGLQFEGTARLTMEAAPVETTAGTVTARAIPRVTNQAESLAVHPLMKQADDLLAVGDIARARLLYEHLAMKESPRAAFALGRTYDPSYLSSIYVRGVFPDIELAARWYRLAEDLGVSEARARLSALGK